MQLAGHVVNCGSEAEPGHHHQNKLPPKSSPWQSHTCFQCHASHSWRGREILSLKKSSVGRSSLRRSSLERFSLERSSLERSPQCWRGTEGLSLQRFSEAGRLTEAGSWSSKSGLASGQQRRDLMSAWQKLRKSANQFSTQGKSCQDSLPLRGYFYIFCG